MLIYYTLDSYKHVRKIMRETAKNDVVRLNVKLFEKIVWCGLR